MSSSDLPAMQTLEPAAGLLGLPICIDERLREWDSGIAPVPNSAIFKISAGS
ncbi:hypothetical protein [Nocardia testacea]|uniref:Uncharacterized protein n=1 Tax=Nocardia testacea TaxID=248551 RepID=A0ABW7VYW3_9NOCA